MTIHSALDAGGGRDVKMASVSSLDRVQAQANWEIPGSRSPVTRTTATPRKDGLFGFNPKCDFRMISVCDSVIEC